MNKSEQLKFDSQVEGLQPARIQAKDRDMNSTGPFSQLLAKGTAAIAIVIGLAMITTPASARWYKWVDEQGNISYQDHPPPSSYENSAQVLNENGVTVKTIPSQQEQRELERIQQLAAEKRHRDEALLKTFSSEQDLITTRDARVLHIDGGVSRMYDQLIILNSRLVSIEDRINERLDRGLNPNDMLESDRIAVIRSIDSTDALIKSKLRERRLVMAQFNRDLDRYRKLKNGSATASFSD